jgi:predicted tellurium resistance membrane protein TerC
MDLLLDPQIWLAFATLTALEIVLGIDNIIFIAILVSRLPQAQQPRARTLGLTAPLFSVLSLEVSGRDLILVLGGIFLIAKSTMEIHNSLEGEEHAASGTAAASFGGVLIQIAILDIVFSLDSVITAVGLVDQVAVMIAAIMVAVGVMMWAAAPISDFVDRHPTIKMLALSFLIMIGMALVGEGFDLHIPKGYVYFAMAFSIAVEMLNIRVRGRRAPPVHLRKPNAPDGDDTLE